MKPDGIPHSNFGWNMARPALDTNPGCFLVGAGFGALAMWVAIRIGVVTEDWKPFPLVLFWLIIILGWLVGPLTRRGSEPRHPEPRPAQDQTSSTNITILRRRPR
jgi:hypothetical protein